MKDAWRGFAGTKWQDNIDVRDFIQQNYTPYTGTGDFLAEPTERTADILKKAEELMALEREKGGVLDIDTENASSLLNYAPGYLDKNKEINLFFQTEAPLKRKVKPIAGIRKTRPD